MMNFRLSSLAIVAVTVLATGCATTQNVISQIHPSSSNTPLEQVLKERSDLVHELATVEIRQYFNTVESPTLAEEKVKNNCLMFLENPDIAKINMVKPVELSQMSRS